ncbi:MAG: flippase-like domain-containing protein [Actinomycetota bacterium]|nr:flippase-like domain-containing protein [Actinomycetota bacterium]
MSDRTLPRRGGSPDPHAATPTGRPELTDTEEHDLEEEMPRVAITRRRLVGFVLFVVLGIAFLYFVLPSLAGLDKTWNRINEGDPWWLLAALAFAVLSFLGYVLLFRGVFAGEGPRIGLAASYQITMAGLAATRLFAAGGAGGLILMAWALRRSGMRRRRVADLTLAFLALTYVVFMAALVVVGLGLYWGVLRGPGPFAMTVVPAIFGATVIVVALALSAVPPDLQRRLERRAERGGRLDRTAQRLANLPAAVSAGTREAVRHVRASDPAVLGSLLYWGSQVAILWAAFRAFGAAPPGAVIVMAFFVGMLGNLLPLPGGIGGVDGAMIGAFAAFGVDVELAIVAVLTYRGFAFWLPTIPGAIAYFQLRRTVARWREERRAQLAGGAAAPRPAE